MDPICMLLVGFRKGHMITELLINEGFKLMSINTIKETLELLSSHSVGAVICNVNYADIDSVELILNIHDVSSGTPVIAIGRNISQLERAAFMQLSKTVMIDTGKNSECFTGDLMAILGGLPSYNNSSEQLSK